MKIKESNSQVSVIEFDRAEIDALQACIATRIQSLAKRIEKLKRWKGLKPQEREDKVASCKAALTTAEALQFGLP